MEAEEIRLHPQDGPSIIQWAARLREEEALLAFKMSCDLPPVGSALASNTFLLIVQTKYQRDMFQSLGGSFMGIDATHNTTHYENVSLFTVITRDRWGHGEAS
jgi:hypothetical protein